jgi:hypothetical protein
VGAACRDQSAAVVHVPPEAFVQESVHVGEADATPTPPVLATTRVDTTTLVVMRMALQRDRPLKAFAPDAADDELDPDLIFCNLDIVSSHSLSSSS